MAEPETLPLSSDNKEVNVDVTVPSENLDFVQWQMNQVQDIKGSGDADASCTQETIVPPDNVEIKTQAEDKEDNCIEASCAQLKIDSSENVDVSQNEIKKQGDNKDCDNAEASCGQSGIDSSKNVDVSQNITYEQVENMECDNAEASCGQSGIDSSKNVDVSQNITYEQVENMECDNAEASCARSGIDLSKNVEVSQITTNEQLENMEYDNAEVDCGQSGIAPSENDDDSQNEIEEQEDNKECDNAEASCAQSGIAPSENDDDCQNYNKECDNAEASYAQSGIVPSENDDDSQNEIKEEGDNKKCDNVEVSCVQSGIDPSENVDVSRNETNEQVENLEHDDASFAQSRIDSSENIGVSQNKTNDQADDTESDNMDTSISQISIVPSVNVHIGETHIDNQAENIENEEVDFINNLTSIAPSENSDDAHKPKKNKEFDNAKGSLVISKNFNDQCDNTESNSNQVGTVPSINAQNQTNEVEDMECDNKDSRCVQISLASENDVFDQNETIEQDKYKECNNGKASDTKDGIVTSEPNKQVKSLECDKTEPSIDQVGVLAAENVDFAQKDTKQTKNGECINTEANNAQVGIVVTENVLNETNEAIHLKCENMDTSSSIIISAIPSENVDNQNQDEDCKVPITEKSKDDPISTSNSENKSISKILQVESGIEGENSYTDSPKTTEEELTKAMSDVCDHLDLNADLSITHNKDVISQRRSKNFKATFKTKSFKEKVCQVLHITGFPSDFSHYHIKNIIGLHSEFNIDSNFYMIDMVRETNSEAYCLIRFVNTYDCQQVYLDLQGISLKGTPLIVKLDLDHNMVKERYKINPKSQEHFRQMLENYYKELKRKNKPKNKAPEKDSYDTINVKNKKAEETQATKVKTENITKEVAKCAEKMDQPKTADKVVIDETGKIELSKENLTTPCSDKAVVKQEPLEDHLTGTSTVDVAKQQKTKEKFTIASKAVPKQEQPNDNLNRASIAKDIAKQLKKETVTVDSNVTIHDKAVPQQEHAKDHLTGTSIAKVAAKQQPTKENSTLNVKAVQKQVQPKDNLTKASIAVNVAKHQVTKENLTSNYKAAPKQEQSKDNITRPSIAPGVAKQQPDILTKPCSGVALNKPQPPKENTTVASNVKAVAKQEPSKDINKTCTCTDDKMHDKDTLVHLKNLPTTPAALLPNLIKTRVSKTVKYFVTKVDEPDKCNKLSDYVLKFLTHADAELACKQLDKIIIGGQILEAKMLKACTYGQIMKDLKKTGIFALKRKLGPEDYYDVDQGPIKRTRFEERVDVPMGYKEPERWSGDTYGLSGEFLKKLGVKLPLTTSIFVQNLHEEVDEAKLFEVFSLAGEVKDIEIICQSTIRAHIEFDHPVEAVQAISLFHKQKLYGNEMHVTMDTKTGNKLLPLGLASIGKGLGDDGQPLRGIRTIMEEQRVNEMFADIGRMIMIPVKLSPFQFKYTKRTRVEPTSTQPNSDSFGDSASSSVTSSTLNTNNSNENLKDADTNASNAATLVTRNENVANDKQIIDLTNLVKEKVKKDIKYKYRNPNLNYPPKNETSTPPPKNLPNMQKNMPRFQTNMPRFQTNNPRFQTNNPRFQTNVPPTETNMPTNQATMLQPQSNMPQTPANMMQPQMNMPQVQANMPANYGNQFMNQLMNYMSSYSMGQNMSQPVNNSGDFTQNYQNYFNVMQYMSQMYENQSQTRWDITPNMMVPMPGQPNMPQLMASVPSASIGQIPVPIVPGKKPDVPPPAHSMVQTPPIPPVPGVKPNVPAPQHVVQKAPVPYETPTVARPSKRKSENDHEKSKQKTHEDLIDESCSSGLSQKGELLMFRNLPASVTSSALSSKMNEVGEVQLCQLTGDGRAMVRFATAEETLRCIRLFKRSKVDGQVIDVSIV